MASITFDTLKFVDTLEKAQLSRDQARAIAEAVRDAQNATDVATKGDLRELEHRMETRFAMRDDELKLHRALLTAVLGGIVALILKTFF